MKMFADGKEPVVAIPVVLEVVAVQVALVAIPVQIRDVAIATRVREGNTICCAKRHPDHRRSRLRPSSAEVILLSVEFYSGPIVHRSFSEGGLPSSVSHQVSSIFWNVSAHTAAEHIAFNATYLTAFRSYGNYPDFGRPKPWPQTESPTLRWQYIYIFNL